MYYKMMMTSGYSFDGYRITNYFGVYSGECALGTGFLSSLGASFADFFGTNSNMYAGKLKEAKEYALERLKEQVDEAGGNAIIGLDIDYVNFSADIMGVVASGTAVTIESINGTDSVVKPDKYPIASTNMGLGFTCFSLFVKPVTSDKYGLSLELFHPDEQPVSAILTDITFTDIFQNKVSLSDIAFTNLKKDKEKYLISDTVYCHISPDVFHTFASVQVTVKKYITGNDLIDLTDTEVEYGSLAIQDANSQISATEIIAYSETLKNAREIYAFILKYNDAHNNSLSPVLLEEIKKIANLERMYGSCKNSCIFKLKEFFELN